MGHTVVLELAFQPLTSGRLEPLTIDPLRVIVWAQEEDCGVPRSRRIAAIPRDNAVETRLQSEAGHEFERVADVDDGAILAGCHVFPRLILGRIRLKAPVAVEEYCEASSVGVREMSNAGVRG